MKNKRIFSFFAAALLVLMLLGGCDAKESADATPPTQESPAETESVDVLQWKTVDVTLYPVDLSFTDYAELELPAEQQPNEAIKEEKTEVSGTEPTVQPTQTPTAQEPMQGEIHPPASELPQTPPAEENDVQPPTIVAFRCEKTDMATATVCYRVQVQVQDETLQVFSGTLYPSEKVIWDLETGPVGSDAAETEEAQTQTETSEDQVVLTTEDYAQMLLLQKLETALLAQTEWINCVQGGQYAQNRKLTKCIQSGYSVLYTNDSHTLFQLQSYNASGLLDKVTEVSADAVSALRDGAITQLLWSDDCNPVLHIPRQEAATQESIDAVEKISAYEDQIQSLGRTVEQEKQKAFLLSVFVAVLTVTNLVCTVCLLYRKKAKGKRKKKNRDVQRTDDSSGKIRSIGTVHNIGARNGQQDSFDVVHCAAGTLAVLADGMGGLADGDKVSQKIVATMRADAMRIRPAQTDNLLCQMTAHANQEVNRMLGAARQYKCGSTLLAVLIEKATMQWITVGDSRIYLYRGGSLIQINREHIYRAELLQQAINGKRSFSEALRDPQADRLSSFIGMGEIKNADFSLNRLKLCAGDRILLMSDGVFNTLSNEEIAEVIRVSPDAAEAAIAMEQRILQKHAPNQDNFTCVILEV